MRHFNERHLYYGSIRLVSAFQENFYPYCEEQYRDKWHVPGRAIRSTDELVTLGTQKGVTVVLVEHSQGGTQQTKLN